VRFYGNPQLPRSAANQARVRAIVSALAARSPVVVLGHSLSIDDHHDFAESAVPGTISVAAKMTPETNLGVQTAVLSRADGFVGTYGGLSYLAPFLGVPAVAAYSVPAKIAPVYLRLAHYAAHSVGGRYRTFDVADGVDAGLAAAVGGPAGAE
jgi:ADP-heptose:LPS heptosyltransferase